MLNWATNRGSSAAQRAAASEACKGITLEALQGQYYRPLSDGKKFLNLMSLGARLVFCFQLSHATTVHFSARTAVGPSHGPLRGLLNIHNPEIIFSVTWLVALML